MVEEKAKLMKKKTVKRSCVITFPVNKYMFKVNIKESRKALIAVAHEQH